MASKIARAEKHIRELAELLTKKRPFKYVFEANARTGQHAVFAEKDEAVADEAAQIAADAIHNLRTALDHAYWEIVSPFATTRKEERAVQFPFSETQARVEEAIKNRLADRVSDKFFDVILGLRPYGEPGGNSMLYAVHHFDGIDKHRKPIPFGDYKRITLDDLKRQILSFPRDVNGVIRAGMNYRDFVWEMTPLPWWPEPAIIKSELDVPVSVVFDIGGGTLMEMVAGINKMRDAVTEAIAKMRSA